MARFDIGFIGRGNSEISKDKLSRYEREAEAAGGRHRSVTFIIVDKLPDTSKTREAAARIGAVIIQMSMKYWPRELAQRIENRLGYKHELQTLRDDEIKGYLAEKLAAIPIQDFLSGVSLEDLEESSDPNGAEAENELKQPENG